MKIQEYESTKEISEYQFELNNSKFSIRHEDISKPLIRYEGDLEFVVHGSKLTVSEKLFDSEKNNNKTFKLNSKTIFSFYGTPNNHQRKHIELIVPTYENANMPVDFSYLSVIVNSSCSDTNIENLQLGKLIFYMSNSSVSLKKIKSNLVKVQTESSRIDMKDICSDNIKLSSVFEDFSLENVISQTLDIDTCTGNINLTNINSDSVFIRVTSGDSNLIGGKINNLCMNVVSGDLSLQNINLITGKIDNTSGDISVQSGIVDDIAVKTVSGDVRVSVLESSINYKTNLNSVTGDVCTLSLENGMPEKISERKGIINIESVTGDIEVTFKGRQKKL